jgi:hypothetical protein
VLNLPQAWETVVGSPHYDAIRRARDELGWNVHTVSSWEDLVAFARDFSRRKFGTGADAATAEEVRR